MRNSWTYFVAGTFLSVLALTAFQSSHAEGGDPRAKSVDQVGLSALKTPVPEAADLDASLKEKEDMVAAKERRLKEVEELLTVQETRLKARIEELAGLQDKESVRKKEETEKREALLATLVKTYESMNPKKAAGVISVMEDDLAVELMMAMKAKKVATVLESMDVNRAMTLSSKIAARRPAAAAIEKGQPRSK